MFFRRLIISSLIMAFVAACQANAGFAQNFSYKVQPGDTFWIVSNKFGVPISSLMEANNATGKTILYAGQTIAIPLDSAGLRTHTVLPGETYWTIHKKYGVDFYDLLEANNATGESKLNVGDTVIIPAAAKLTNPVVHTVQAGESYWKISQKYRVGFHELLEFNGADENSKLYIGQKIKIPLEDTSVNKPQTSPAQSGSKPYITYTNYTVQKNDDIWSIAFKFGIPAYELTEANNMDEPMPLAAGTVLKIPIHHIPVKSTPGPEYGELLDWWAEAQYVIPRGSAFEVVDFYTGKSFFAKRTTGSNHADCETVSAADTDKMKEIWGGNFSWTRRPVIIKYKGRKIAASATAMPHAGNDSAPGGVYTSWRSGGYPAGTNHDYIKGNGMDGHFDIHFFNSTRHKDGKLDPMHQECVKISAGVK